VKSKGAPRRRIAAHLHELGVFVSEAVADFRTTAAVVPSSRYLTQAMVRPVEHRDAPTVVELGAGTGAITEALLRHLPVGATLLALELNQRFVRYLTRRITDRRLVVVQAGAEALSGALRDRGLGPVNAVISSIAFGYLSDAERRELLRALIAHMAQDAVLTQYQYIHGLQYRERAFNRFDLGAVFSQYFRFVERTVVWRNLPPAFVYTCRR
jgi:phosphatidylethanolamine/phosphatidyl-N-methylethanolamine N-methyltransferase